MSQSTIDLVKHTGSQLMKKPTSVIFFFGKLREKLRKTAENCGKLRKIADRDYPPLHYVAHKRVQSSTSRSPFFFKFQRETYKL